MSVRQKSGAHRIVHDRLCEAFGPPDNSLGRDDHWALRPEPGAISINLLLNGSSDVPAVWVFDPFDHENGVIRAFVERECDLEEIIEAVGDRLKRALASLQHAL